MKARVIVIAALVAAAGIGWKGYAAKRDREYVATRLGIGTLPGTTMVETCRAQDNPDGLPVTECLLRTTPDDVQRLLAGHAFREVNAPSGSIGRQALPGGSSGVQGINLFFETASGRASIEVHEP